MMKNILIAVFAFIAILLGVQSCTPKQVVGYASETETALVLELCLKDYVLSLLDFDKLQSCLIERIGESASTDLRNLVAQHGADFVDQLFSKLLGEEGIEPTAMAGSSTESKLDFIIERLGY